jgi:hypothetical protein
VKLSDNDFVLVPLDEDEMVLDPDPDRLVLSEVEAEAVEDHDFDVDILDDVVMFDTAAAPLAQHDSSKRSTPT